MGIAYAKSQTSIFYLLDIATVNKMRGCVGMICLMEFDFMGL